MNDFLFINLSVHGGRRTALTARLVLYSKRLSDAPFSVRRRLRRRLRRGPWTGRRRPR